MPNKPKQELDPRLLTQAQLDEYAKKNFKRVVWEATENIKSGVRHSLNKTFIKPNKE